MYGRELCKPRIIPYLSGVCRHLNMLKKKNPGIDLQVPNCLYDFFFLLWMFFILNNKNNGAWFLNGIQILWIL